MSRNKEKAAPETLKDAIKELIRLAKAINTLEQVIDENWGVQLIAGYIPGFVNGCKADIHVRRGIEAIEEALGKEGKYDAILQPNELRRLRYEGIEFTQYADKKTMTFVKAGKEPPKIVIVEE